MAHPPAWQFDDVTLQRLADELARDVYPLDDILGRFGIDPHYFQRNIRPNEAFLRHYREKYRMWHSEMSTVERIKAKAQATFEEWLQEADRLYHDPKQPLAAKVELMKTMGRVGGLDHEKNAVVAPGDRVQVIINLAAAGATPITIDKVAPVIDVSAQ